MPQQPLILGVAHHVDPPAQRVAARAVEQLLQQRAVLHREHLPACRGEHALESPGADGRHDPVQGLPVEVDDPHDLTEFGDHRVDDGFPHRTLVEFGVADDRVLPARG